MDPGSLKWRIIIPIYLGSLIPCIPQTTDFFSLRTWAIQNKTLMTLARFWTNAQFLARPWLGSMLFDGFGCTVVIIIIIIITMTTIHRNPHNSSSSSTSSAAAPSLNTIHRNDIKWETKNRRNVNRVQNHLTEKRITKQSTQDIQKTDHVGAGQAMQPVDRHVGAGNLFFENKPSGPMIWGKASSKAFV